MNDLSIISLNARGMNSYEKRQKNFDWLRDTNVHIALIQETHFVEKNQSKYNSRWFGKCFHAFSNSPHARGVSVLFNNVDIDVENVHKTQDGRILLLNINFQNNAYTIVNIYSPNSETERVSFFKKLKAYISKYALHEENIILGGDFNCVFDKTDRKNKTTAADKSTNILIEILNKFNLNDTWKKIQGLKPGFTWCNSSNKPVSRIDYIFLSQIMLAKVHKIRVQQVPGTHSDGIRLSDHKAIKLSVTVNENERGKGYWKLNTSLLNDKKYKMIINDLIHKYNVKIANLNTINVHDLWEQLKQEIRSLSISYSKSLSKSYKKSVMDLEKQIQDIEDKPANEINMKEKRTLENELTHLYDKKSRGAQIRSRVKWIEEGERNTSYFLRLENYHQSDNVIRKVTEQTKSVYNDNDILNEICSFYDKLYESKHIDDNEIQNYLNEVNIEQKLDENGRLFCDEMFTLQECKEAVMNLKDNKSPGMDGIPNEFYKTFWNEIKDIFYATLEYTFETGNMPFTQRLSLLSLLHKKGERDKIKNYRPISLTNSDYKILAFVLARRLQKVVDNLINEDQTAYIKGRFIGFSARTILDIYEYCENSNDPQILLFCDFEKAFDSVEWNFLFKTLEKFNFGASFMQWIKIMYKDPIFRVKNNGWISKTCKMNRGIRQGCPLSALLFIFVAEVLACNIRSNKDINGFKIKEMKQEIKIVQHADDCTIPIKNEKSLQIALNTIDIFCKHSGLKLNKDKTECLLLGKLKGTKKEILNLKVNENSIKALGIHIGHSKEECFEKNWIRYRRDIEKLLDSWRTRKLTIFGKCCIINSLAISKLVYAATLLPTPGDEFIKEINKIIFNFIWNKKDRIKRNTLIGDKLKGGIHIVDLKSKFKALKASWIPKIISCNHKLKDFFQSFCQRNQYDIYYLLKTNDSFLSESGMLHKYIPYFYREIITYFNEAKGNSTTLQFSQNIWKNKRFTYKNETLCFTNWMKSGVLKVDDLFNEIGFKDITDFSNLTNKHNWLCEYKILRNVFNKISHKTEYHIEKENVFLFKNGKIESIIGKSCKFFYDIFVDDKFQRSYMESMWEKTFMLEKSDWTNIYRNNVCKVVDKNVAEFNYKLLHNLLCNNYLLSKWKKDVHRNCTFCADVIENNAHLIFECQNVRQIWNTVEMVLEIDIRWKHIVLGFFHEDNPKVHTFNFVISYIAFRIYKSKMMLRLENKTESVNNLLIQVKLDCYRTYLTLRKSKYDFLDHKLFERLSLLL